MLLTWASAEIFPEGGNVSIFLILVVRSLSGCCRCNANVRSRNTLPFIHGYATKKMSHVMTIVTKMRFAGSYS